MTVKSSSLTGKLPFLVGRTNYPTFLKQMSCNLRKQTLDALRSEAEGLIAKARVNVEVYLHNPVGIGEHPDVLSAIQDQLDVIAEQQERIEVLNSFSDTHS